MNNAEQAPSALPLVALFENEPLASTIALAAGLHMQHASIIKLVRKHRASLERFGPIRFEIQARLPGRHGGGDVQFALLNEHQSTLLIAMMRNTALVIECKVRLVEEFFRMRDALRQNRQGLWQQLQALVAREVESRVRASFGSHLMHERKREIPVLHTQRQYLESAMQPMLPMFH